MLHNDFNETTRLYFNKIKVYKPLTLKEEKKLFKSYKKGDEKSKEEIINRNLKFVVSIAKNYRNRGVPFSDLISEGNYGLMRSLEKYDFKKENKLSSYAIHWIRYFIEEKIKTENPNGYYSFDDTFLNSTEYNEELGIVEEVSFDTVEDNYDYEDESYYSVLANNLLRNYLSDRESEIIKYSYGIGNYPILTLNELSKKYKVSKERIRQIREKSLLKLRAKCLENDIDIY